MATTPSLIATFSSELAALVGSASRHVVSVAARAHRPACGVILGGDLVLTAAHVVERDADIAVFVDSTRHEAALVGRDPGTDIAVLRVAGLNAPEPPTAPPPAPGSIVISLSRTGTGTVSTSPGVVTSVGGPLRTGRGTVLPDFFRTDAALRSGTSGGAIVDTAERVIGMSTSGLLRGLPVVIPIAHARDIAQRLISKRPLGRGYLGVGVQSVKLPDRQKSVASSDRALIVLGVSGDGAADRAGILVGDVLVRFKDRALTDVDDLQDALAGVEPGSETPLTIVRGNVLQQVTVSIGERPER